MDKKESKAWDAVNECESESAVFARSGLAEGGEMASSSSLAAAFGGGGAEEEGRQWDLRRGVLTDRSNVLDNGHLGDEGGDKCGYETGWHLNGDGNGDYQNFGHLNGDGNGDYQNFGHLNGDGNGDGQNFGHLNGDGQNFGHLNGDGQNFGHLNGDGQNFGHLNGDGNGDGQNFGHLNGDGNGDYQNFGHLNGDGSGNYQNFGHLTGDGNGDYQNFGHINIDGNRQNHHPSVKTEWSTTSPVKTERHPAAAFRDDQHFQRLLNSIVFSKCTGAGCDFLLGHTLTSNLIECPKCGSVVDLLAAPDQAIFASPEDYPARPFAIHPRVVAYWGGADAGFSAPAKFSPENVSRFLPFRRFFS